MASVILVLGIAPLAALFMSFTVGANSNSAPVAPAVGANASRFFERPSWSESWLGSEQSSKEAVSPRPLGKTS
ncbi:hypothetical protein RBH20_18275 [Haloarcula sp. H-GB4]|nr:hypothetical protein [Haloarcula sp. H-GB4]MDQ2074482.1 hypothetical protein [Haloarcula sp. H-GB4]